ncbi:hypothetical protein AB6A40_002829 [Gnathostoma spinigerum]|uniref:RWD domain-containing protein n=1 Tax=Gnathostoma spinigerum TaxID=75299 RepID=A0ABD6E8X0_9BILA
MEERSPQLDEIQSIEAIFGDLIHLESTSRINVQFERGVQLTIDLPPDYPERSPPIFELSGPELSITQRTEISNSLQDIFVKNLGQPILFEWIEYMNRYISENCVEARLCDECDDTNSYDAACSAEAVDFSSSHNLVCPEIVSGDILRDRKSTFQAHLAPLETKQQVNIVLNKLKENGKIARATHNMYAWVLEEQKNGNVIRFHDCEDDGEHGAGAKLLHLLELMKAKNVIVIVTRWYGGIHLGPDRFRHICNIARKILVDCGYSNRS